MPPIKLALIGAGVIGARHAALIHAHDACTLAGICDVDPTRQALADNLGVPFYSAAEALLHREQPAGAIIATPNAQHAAAAELCAAHGVHALIEKPVAETLDQARRIVATADSHGTRVLVGHHRRHNPLVQKARELVHAGALGQLVGVSMLWALKKPDDYFRIGWRSQRPGGGPLLINLIHELDTLRFICGEIDAVCARTSSAVRGFEVEDTLSISITFANGALGTVLASDATPGAWSYEATTGENPLYFRTRENCYHFLGTAASLAFPRMELWRYADETHQGWQHPLERLQVAPVAADPLQRQLAHFCRVIQGEEPPLINARDGAASLAVALAVQESAHEGVAVQPQVMID